MKGRKKAVLFVNKKNQKNFILHRAAFVVPQGAKVFCGAFFQKSACWLPSMAFGLVALCAASLPAKADIRFCVDKANSMFGIDQAVANAAAAASGQKAVFYVHDSSQDDPDDDSAYKEKKYFTKLESKCDLIMGFPVEAKIQNLPDGMAASLPYARTGFVAVTTTAPNVAFTSMVARQKIGVLLLSVASTYFTEQTMRAEHIYDTNDDLFAALNNHEVDVALIWQPWLVQELALTKQEVNSVPLQMPHAVWNMVALYPQSGQSSQAVKDFNAGVAAMAANGKLSQAVAPFDVPNTNE
jgi:ABC-type amino acid transport substrate-binding protein